jgi:CheY-like chemotaxis protein
VIDNGRGIPKTEHTQIFEEFRQLQNPERDRSKGLGLGLAICARLAAIIGVTIKLKSAPKAGASFYFELPLVEGDDRESSDRIRDKAFSKPTDYSSLSILILDDEQDIRNAMKMMLLEFGVGTILAATSEDEAIDAIRETDVPDLIISDFRLREGRTGIDAIKAIWSTFGKEVQAILVTGDTSPESLSAIKESGVATLHKPVDSKQLIRLINEVI